MGLTEAEWDSWRKHTAAVAADYGLWVGLCNGYGEPVMDLPLTTFNMTEAHLDPGNVEATVPTAGNTVPVHMASDLLIADNLGVQTEDTALVPNTNDAWTIGIETATGERYGFPLQVPLASVDHAGPYAIELKGTGLAGALEWWPCPSVTATWGDVPYSEWVEDAAGPYEKPRELAPVQMATVAWGHSDKGPAVTVIRNIIQDSLDAVNAAHGWSDRPHMVVEYSNVEDTSPEVIIQRDDRYVWDTIADPARLTGTSITARLWWPGDEPILVRRGEGAELTSFPFALGVVEVKQLGG